jgi:hypothetical protein
MLETVDKFFAYPQRVVCCLLLVVKNNKDFVFHKQQYFAMASSYVY